MKEETATCPVFDPPDMHQNLWQEMDDAFEDSKIKSIWPSVLLLAMRPRQNTSDLGCGLSAALQHGPTETDHFNLCRMYLSWLFTS